MELLIIALVVTGWMTKVVQNGRTDRAYAKKGQVSPRHQVRLARLEKAGRPASPRARGPLRNYLGELWADALLDLGDKHRSKREQRGPVTWDPNRPTLRQRAARAADGFDTAVLDGIDKVKASRGWDRTKAGVKRAGRVLVDPVGGPQPADLDGRRPSQREVEERIAEHERNADSRDAWAAEGQAGYEWGAAAERGQAANLKATGSYRPPPVGARFDDMEWTGDVWAPLCRRCDRPMAGRDSRGWLICEVCGLRASERNDVKDEAMTAKDDGSTLTAADAEELRAGTGADTFAEAAEISQGYADYYAVCEGREAEAAWMRRSAEVLRDADRNQSREDDNAGWYDPAHLTGDQQEDALTRQGRCPHYNDVDNGYGAPAGLCGATRSPNEGDHPFCKAHAARIRDDRGRGGYVAPAGDVDEHLPLEQPSPPNTEPSGGSTMTEATTYETAVPALGALQEAMSDLSDAVAGAESAADDFVAHVEEIDAAKTTVTDAAQLVQEQLAAAGLNGSAMEQVTAAMEQVQTGDLAAAQDHIVEAKRQLSDAKTAAAEAAGAAGQAQQDMQDELGDAHERVASNLSGNGAFLDSGGGAPAYVVSSSEAARDYAGGVR